MDNLKLSKEHILEGIDDCNADLVYWQHQLESVQKHIETAKKNLTYFEEQLKLITDGQEQKTGILGQSESENTRSTGTDIEREIGGNQEQLLGSVSVKLNIPDKLRVQYEYILRNRLSQERIEKLLLKVKHQFEPDTYERFPLKNYCLINNQLTMKEQRI